ncbi:MAG: APC family permease, partial [Nitrososphaerales archaeon]
MTSSSAPGKTIFVRQATGLVRQISAWEALGMVVTQMGLLYVFNAIVFTPAFYPTANPFVGPVVGLLLVLPIAGVYILFSIAIPRTGGDYVWVGRIFNPGLGFVTNFSLTIIVISVVGAVAPWIASYSLGPMFYDLGILGNNSNYINIANSLETQTSQFIVAAIFIIIAGAIVMASSKLAGRVVKYWAFLSLIIGAIFIGVALSAGQTTFANNFNNYATQIGSNMTYNNVISAGQQLGAYNGVPPALSQATFSAAALGLLGYLGFNTSAYFAGEVKQNRRSQILAQFGGTLLYTALVGAILAVEYFMEGPSFVNAIAQLWLNGSSNYPYLVGSIPLASGLSMFWTNNQVLVSIFNLAFGLTAVVMNISIFFMLSRNLFAWSFDRVVSTKFADINERTRTPLYAIGAMVIIGLFFAYIAVFGTGVLSSLFNIGTAGQFLVFLIVAFAAIAFPYRRKDIFDSAEPLARRKIGGIPLITILGILSVAVSIFTIYSI